MAHPDTKYKNSLFRNERNTPNKKILIDTSKSVGVEECFSKIDFVGYRGCNFTCLDLQKRTFSFIKQGYFDFCYVFFQLHYISLQYECRFRENFQNCSIIKLTSKYCIRLNATRGFIFRSGFFCKVLFKFDLPRVLIEIGFYWLSCGELNKQPEQIKLYCFNISCCSLFLLIW